jgi:hypothetical protein
MRHLAALSDVEFEHLVSDLLYAETRQKYERFGVGPDGGIDLRHTDASGAVEVVQCKHYSRSSFSQLNTAAGKEPAKLNRLDPRPARYRFVVSQSLTPGQKDKLIEALDGWVDEPGDIWGAEKIEDLLDIHEDVERRHVKLWLSSSQQLEKLLNAGTHNRSNDLIERITEALPRYVQTSRFADAQKLLEESGVCLIAGVPGIGKTTLAQMLLLDCAQQGFEPLYVSENISEAWDALTERPQVFYYDDFLGRIGLAGLSKNEDQRLVDFIAKANRDPRKVRLILTTREYILRDAVSLYDTLGRAAIDHKRFLLALSDYTRYERGLVLYNHLYHSERLRPEWLRELLEDRAYVRIVDHLNYNPRLVEFITGLSQSPELDHIEGGWVEFAVAALDNPQAIWRRAFERELNDVQRAILICLVSFGTGIDYEVLKYAATGLSEAMGLKISDPDFDRALNVLEATFLRTDRLGETIAIDVANPSISDYVVSVIAESPALIEQLIKGSLYFAQLKQLWELSTTHEAPAIRGRLQAQLDSRLGELADAFARTIDTPAIAERYFEPVNGSIVVFAESGVLESRLKVVFDACGKLVAEDEPFVSWLKSQLVVLEANWKTGRCARRAAVRLYGSLHENAAEELLADGAFGASLKRRLARSLSSSADFDALNDLWSVDPEIFSLEERDDLIGYLEGYAEDVLQAEDVDAEELYALERVAGEYGVVLDQDYVDEARDRAREKDWEPDIDDERRAAVDEVQEEDLDELFARLRPAEEDGS